MATYELTNMAKKPGLRARAKSVQAAMTVAHESETSSRKVTLTVRLPEATYERVRQLAFDQRRSQHSILLEGVDMALAKHG